MKELGYRKCLMCKFFLFFVLVFVILAVLIFWIVHPGLFPFKNPLHTNTNNNNNNTRNNNNNNINNNNNVIFFTIKHSEYLSNGNINHWMLALSQINEIIAQMHHDRFVLFREDQHQQQQKKTTNDLAILRFEVSKNARNFFKVRNNPAVIRYRLQRNAFVRFTIHAMSKLYDVSFHLENELENIISTILKPSDNVNYNVYTYTAPKGYLNMHHLARKIVEMCHCPQNVTSKQQKREDFSNIILVYNRKNSRRIEDAEIERLRKKLMPKNEIYQVDNIFIDDRNPCAQFCTVSKPYKAIISPHGAQFAQFFATFPKTILIEIIPHHYNTEGFNNYIRLSIKNRWFLAQDYAFQECYPNTIDGCYDKLPASSSLDCSSRRCQLEAKSVHSLRLSESMLRNISNLIMLN